MKYEIPREMFKQRLEDKHNFAFVNVQDKVAVSFEAAENIPYGPQFKASFTAKYPSKTQNVILFSLEKGNDAASRAAEELSQDGYQFVYFYHGTADDVVLDKGLN